MSDDKKDKPLWQIREELINRNTGVNSAGVYPTYKPLSYIPNPLVPSTDPKSIRTQANNQWGDDDYASATPWLIPSEPTHVPEIECHCGWSKTLGKDDSAEYHSDYCPIYTRWKATNR